MQFSKYSRAFLTWKQKLFPKNNQKPPTNDHWHNVRTKFLIGAATGAAIFLLLFLTDLSYLYGSLFRNSDRYHNFHYLVVDYDGGPIGKAFQATYYATAGSTMPTAYFHPPADYPTTEDVYRAVWHGDFAFAVYISEGASDRLSAALKGGEAAASYNPSQAMTWIWNQQNFPTYQEAITEASFQKLAGQVSGFYYKLNPNVIRSLNQSDPQAVQALVQPIAYTEINIKPTPQGAVVLHTTASMAMPVLQQFFFLMALNAVCAKCQLYSHVSTRRSTTTRYITGIIYSFFAALVMTGYYFAFREGWDLNTAQFFLTWAAIWLLMHVHFLIFDTFMALVPMPVMPIFVLSWIFVNIASTTSPLSIQPSFYHWSTVTPAHNTVLTLFTIWAGGASNKLHRTLPLMFSWWIFGNVTSALAQRRVCMIAKKRLVEAVEPSPPSVASGSTAASVSDAAQRKSGGNELEEGRARIMMFLQRNGDEDTT